MNLHPANKLLGTDLSENNEVQINMLGYNNVRSAAVKNDVSMDEQPRLCSVRITRLTEKDIQRFCGAPNAPTPQMLWTHMWKHCTEQG